MENLQIREKNLNKEIIDVFEIQNLEYHKRRSQTKQTQIKRLDSDYFALSTFIRSSR